MEGKEMEEIRLKIGWTKRELANRLGVSEITIFNYIKKNTAIPEPVSKLMQMLAEKAGVQKEV